MPADCLSKEEIETLRSIYRRDVKYWGNWESCVKAAKKDGQCPMGLSWVILRFKPGPALPRLREQINAVYLQCLQEYTEQYGLSICVDVLVNKVVVYDPKRAPAEWLENVIVPAPIRA